MAEMYFNLVKAHRRTCNPNNKAVKLVPENYIREVSDMLTADGRDLDGNII